MEGVVVQFLSKGDSFSSQSGLPSMPFAMPGGGHHPLCIRCPSWRVEETHGHAAYQTQEGEKLSEIH
jgi:hypothetical protein